MVRVLSLNATDGGTTLHRPLLARLAELAAQPGWSISRTPVYVGHLRAVLRDALACRPIR